MMKPQTGKGQYIDLQRCGRKYLRFPALLIGRFSEFYGPQMVMSVIHNKRHPDILNDLGAMLLVEIEFCERMLIVLDR